MVNTVHSTIFTHTNYFLRWTYFGPTRFIHRWTTLVHATLHISNVMDNYNSWMVGWLCWGLTSQSTIFQSCRDGAIASWVINQYFRGVKCLAQGHNTATVGLEPRTSRSGVRHSTTEPPRSPNSWMVDITFDWRHAKETAVECNNQTWGLVYNFPSPLILQDWNQNFINNEQKRCKNKQ